MRIKKRRGSTEFLYLIIVLALTTTIIATLNNYSRNVIYLNKISTKNNNDIIDINNIHSKIEQSIQNGEYEKLTKENDYSIKIKKINDNFKDNKSKTLRKNYKNTKVINLNKNEEFILNKESNKNYFLFSDSKIGLNIGYNSNSNNYTIGEIKDTFYYGIENSSTILNKTLYLKSNENNSKCIYLSFDSNITKYDFFIAKVEKENEEYYSVYMVTENEIIQIYSFNNKGGE